MPLRRDVIGKQTPVYQAFEEFLLLQDLTDAAAALLLALLHQSARDPATEWYDINGNTYHVRRLPIGPTTPSLYLAYRIGTTGYLEPIAAGDATGMFEDNLAGVFVGYPDPLLWDPNQPPEQLVIDILTALDYLERYAQRQR